MKVIATDIKNLTDARYFAAWGVDVMCYDIDPDSPGSLSLAEFAEIANWVEGPETGITAGGLSLPATIDQTDVSVDHLIIGPYIDRSAIPAEISRIYRIATLSDIPEDESQIIIALDRRFTDLPEVQIASIRAHAEAKEVYLDGAFSVADLPLMQDLGVTGIILKGGEEEKVGYKSFEELDDLLEAIYD